MNMQEQFHTAAPLQGTSRKRTWIKVLAVLAFLALATSWLVGYMLGRSAVPKSSGQVIDTILLTPGDEDAQPLHLTGQIVYPDGTPYAGGQVRLHSDVKETATDSVGRFAFFNIERGRHTISVTDDNGKVLAQSILDLSDAAENTGASIKKDKDGTYTAELAADVRLLEVVVELDSNSKILNINPDRLTYVTSKGKVVTPAGEATYREGTVVTPGGTIVTTDGTIITPSREGPLGIAVIKTDESVTYPDGKLTLADGTVVTDKGTVALPNGSVITLDGGTVIKTPDGKEVRPGESGVIISGGNTVRPIGTDMGHESEQEGTSGSKRDTNKEAGTTGSGSRGDAVSGTHAGGDITDIPRQDVPAGPDIPDVPEPDDELPAFEVSWTQGAEIDLFARRTDGGKDGDDIIPGSKGYYPFRLKNGNSFPVDFDLSVSEGSLHIPMRFRIVNADSGNEVLSGWWNTKKNAVSDSETVRLPAGETIQYNLEWEWPYEHGDDAADTLAGADEKGIYTVELKIHAEQAVQ